MGRSRDGFWGRKRCGVCGRITLLTLGVVFGGWIVVVLGGISSQNNCNNQTYLLANMV